MTPPAANSSTIFETTLIAPDDPVWQRPYSALALDLIVEAARIVTAYPAIAAVQKYRVNVVSLRITPDEFEELLALRAELRAAEIAAAPLCVHRS